MSTRNMDVVEDVAGRSNTKQGEIMAARKGERAGVGSYPVHSTMNSVRYTVPTEQRDDSVSS